MRGAEGRLETEDRVDPFTAILYGEVRAFVVDDVIAVVDPRVAASQDLYRVHEIAENLILDLVYRSPAGTYA